MILDHGAVGDYRTHEIATRGDVFSAGGPIWGLDWCPGPSRRLGHYLAITTLPNVGHQPRLGERVGKDDPGCIQIWSLAPQSESISIGGQERQGGQADREGESGDGSDGGMKCEMVLCVDGGWSMEVKWMPLGAWDEVSRCQIRVLPELSCGCRSRVMLVRLTATHYQNSASSLWLNSMEASRPIRFLVRRQYDRIKAKLMAEIHCLVCQLEIMVISWS